MADAPLPASVNPAASRAPDPVAGAEPASAAEQSRRRTLAMLVVLLGLGVVVVDSTLLNLALPSIARQMNATAAHSIWAVNAYQLATLVCLLPFANLGDRLGYRQVYLGGTVVFVAGAVLAAFSQNLAMLVFARALQGVGGGAMMSVNTALIRLIYPPDRIGRGIALNSMVVAMSSVAGPTIAALVLGVASWRWLFFISIPLAVTVLVLGRRVLPLNPHRRPAEAMHKRDVVFNVLMFVLLFVGADLLAMRGTSGEADWRTLGLAMMAAAVVVGVFYMRRQARLSTPLFPVDLMRMPIFALSMGASVSAFAAMSLATVSMPFLLQDGFGKTPFQAGILLTAWPAAIVVMAPLAGRLIGRVHSGLLGGIGMTLMALGMLALALLPAHPGDWDIAWRLALAGAGFGLFQSPNNHTIVTSPPPHRAGAASGMLGTARLTGMTLGAVVVAQIFATWPPAQGVGPHIALWVGLCASIVAGLCSVARVRTAVQTA
ncbi:MFS transporter [Comamonas serinivorans]|uniref:MFS transporter n=1 Tax=Comamonas serinivorans TaxID=1082851 RepID=A0A1Y0EJ42_9BURK|nr:MFS transporter [Comamonas serinivorans]ARU03655.1 MFS transporter [Comamonas serinivorans]